MCVLEVILTPGLRFEMKWMKDDRDDGGWLKGGHCMARGKVVRTICYSKMHTSTGPRSATSSILFTNFFSYNFDFKLYAYMHLFLKR